MNGYDRKWDEKQSTLMGQFAKLLDAPGDGRTLEELKTTEEVLKGQESQRLRAFCTSNCMEPRRDLDSFGRLLMTGSLEEIIVDYASRIEMKMKAGMDSEAANQAIANDLYSR